MHPKRMTGVSLPTHPKSGNNSLVNRIFALPRPVLLGAVVVVATLCLWASGGASNKSENADMMATSGQENVATRHSKGEVVLGETSNGIAYYHCSSSRSKQHQPHLVLLHGAKFTKEDWKTSGILQNFCSSKNVGGVTALDLPTQAGFEELKAVLTSMETDGLLTLPRVALVTPSASGKTITGGIEPNLVDEFPQYLEYWIPVAPPSVKAIHPVENLEVLKGKIEILSICGDRDTMGNTVNDFLGKYAGAKTLILEGGHPVYLDSPDAFVKAVENFLH